MGDAIFDSFYSSTVPSLVSEKETSEKMKEAGPALLDKIGVSSQYGLGHVKLSLAETDNSLSFF
jgi:hypothetical protein